MSTPFHFDPLELPPEYSLLGTILERLFEKSGSEFAKASRACYDNASWVGFRLAEALPLAVTASRVVATKGR